MGRRNKQRRVVKKRKRIRKEKESVQKKLAKDTSGFGPVFTKLENPFSDINDVTRSKIIREIAEKSEEKFHTSIRLIQDIFRKHDVFLLLASLASYGLTIGVGNKGVKSTSSASSITQSHVEICQALALQINPEELEFEPIIPPVVQKLWDAVIELTTSLNFRNLADSFEESSEQKKAISLLQHRIRGSTQIVRNWGYYLQVITISSELYSYFDNDLENKFGFSASMTIRFFQLLVSDIEERNTRRFKTLSFLRKMKKNSDLVFRYHETIGLSRERALEFIEEFDVENIPHETLFVFVLSHFDLWLSEIYEIGVDDVSRKLETTNDVAKKLLSHFSYKLGELAEYNTEYIFLANPVWLKPIISLGNNKYFCAIPQVFFSFIIQSLDSLIEKINKDALSQRRATYLEQKIREIVNKRFPESNTASGVKWRINDVEYETDLITFIDSHAVIVEAKSGKISDPALRGAPQRLQKHIEEILIAPNLQSKRLSEKIYELIDNPDIENDLRRKLPVDINKIRKVIRVSVSLEDFGSIQANIAKLQETGWLPEDFEPCPTMNLADFETLFDFLEHPIQIIHYLSRRQEIEKTLGYMGDELDLMGLYISTLFNIGDVDAGTDFLISGMSSPLDAYYQSIDAGIHIDKPIPKISALFKDILEQLEEIKTYRWTEIGVILSMFSPDDQAKLSKMIYKLKRNVKKYWGIEGHHNTAVVIPPKASEFSLCYVIYNNNNAHMRDSFIRNAAMVGLEPDHVRQCLIVAKNIDKDDLHYHFIGLVE